MNVFYLKISNESYILNEGRNNIGRDRVFGKIVEERERNLG